MQARKGERGCMPITWTPKDQMQAAKAADARGWWVQFLLCPGWRKRVRFAFASEFGYGELVLGFGFVAFVAFASFRCVGSMLMRHTFGILSIVTHTHTHSHRQLPHCAVLLLYCIGQYCTIPRRRIWVSRRARVHGRTRTRHAHLASKTKSRFPIPRLCSFCLGTFVTCFVMTFVLIKVTEVWL